MKRARRIAILAGAALCGALLGLPAHAFSLTDIDGHTHTLAGYRGKWVVVNIWATWCAPCIREMPELQALAQARADVVVLGAAADGTPAALRKFGAALGVRYPLAATGRDTLAAWKVRGFPTTLLYNPGGELVLTKLGQVTRSELEAALMR